MRICHIPIGSATAVALLTGCAVGPDWHKPPAPDVHGYAPEALPSRTGSADAVLGGSEQLIEGRDIPGEWWALFHCEELNELVRVALKNNPDLKAAQAALRGARENVLAQQGAFWPSVGATYNLERQRTADPLASPLSSGEYVFNLHTAELDVSYVPDVFGANRREVESLRAQAESQRFELLATYLTLTSNLVNAAVGEASIRAQVAATVLIIADETKVLESYRRQLALGQLAEADVATQEAALAQVEATLPPLQKQLEQQRDLLVALSGGLPDQRLAAQFELKDFTLPEELPVSLPASLVKQRPDILAAEEQVHSASAQIGVAVANRLPNIQIDASAGASATAFNQLLASGTSFWTLGATLTQPIFQGGTLLHRQRAAEAAYEQSVAQYRSTVVSAFQNVADSLHAILSDSNALEASAKSERAAGRALTIARRQLELGDVSETVILNDEVLHAQALLAVVQAQANRLSDCVALFQALGGGWWNRPETPGARDHEPWRRRGEG